jgi:tRNA(Ile)-lysidine synthase
MRAETEEYLREKNADFIVESSHLDEKYTRNKISHHIIPQLLDINENLYNTINKTTEILRCEEEYLAEQTEYFWGLCFVEPLGLRDFSHLHKAIHTRLIIKLLKESGAEYSAEIVERIEGLLQSGGKINVKENVYFTAKEGILLVTSDRKERKSTSNTVNIP